MFAGFPSWVTAGIEREWCRLSEKSISRPPLRSTRLASDPTNKEGKSNEAKEITEEKKNRVIRGAKTRWEMRECWLQGQASQSPVDTREMTGA
jgi:hypothetical protein